MRNTNKKLNIVLLFALIGMFFCPNLAYSVDVHSLRVPLNFEDESENDLPSIVSGKRFLWKDEWDQPPQWALDVAKKYMKYWDTRMTSEGVSAGTRFDDIIISGKYTPRRLHIVSQEAAYIYQAICKLNFDWGACMLVSAHGGGHNAVSYILGRDTSMPYLVSALNRAIELLQTEPRITCIDKTFDIHYSDEMFIYVIKRAPLGVEERILKHLKPEKAAFIIERFYYHFQNESERLVLLGLIDKKEVEIKEISFYKKALTGKPEIIKFLSPEVCSWLGIPKIGQELPDDSIFEGL